MPEGRGEQAKLGRVILDEIAIVQRGKTKLKVIFGNFKNTIINPARYIVKMFFLNNTLPLLSLQNK